MPGVKTSAVKYVEATAEFVSTKSSLDEWMSTYDEHRGCRTRSGAGVLPPLLTRIAKLRRKNVSGRRNHHKRRFAKYT